MRFLLFIFLLLTFSACKTAQVGTTSTSVDNRTVIREVVHDTVFVTNPDSSQMKLQLSADSAGKITGKLLSVKNGNYLKAPDITIKDNVLTVDCYAEAQRLFAAWKVTYTDSVSKTVIQLPPVTVEKQLTNWQRVEIWLGRVFILVFIGFLVFLFLKYWPKK